MSTRQSCLSSRQPPAVNRPPRPVRSRPSGCTRCGRYWAAANYLSVGQIYLLDNPLLTEPLVRKHVKPRLLGHWGTTPGAELRLRPSQPA